MSRILSDQAARDRFRTEWQRNFAVSANAGSGKTTAISERLAAVALGEAGAEILRKTAVVTFTKKAAAQIGQRARAVLVRRLAEAGRTDLAPLDHLERAFFGTIHSFCLLLAQRYGQALGIHLNPAVVEGPDAEEALWEEFIEQDPMQFTALRPEQVEAYLRHAPIDSIFALSQQLDRAQADKLRSVSISARPPEPPAAALTAIRSAKGKAGRGAEALRQNQEQAQRWLERFRSERGFLPIPKPQGKAAGIEELYAAFFAPLKGWLAAAGAALAGELALRFRAWRFERGVQTYTDQIEAALAVLNDATILERIRAEGWRVLLDEAQDTDPHQFAVLVEITRPPGAVLATWPAGGGEGPRHGHFSLVGDAQQSIYGSRADVRNFEKHLQAFARELGGERLMFDVTFRAPQAVIARLNETLPVAFGPEREHNLGFPPEEGAPAPRLQVGYEHLVAGPENEPGVIATVPITAAPPKTNVEARLAAEVRQLAAWLRAAGPAAVGAQQWGEVCILAPRNEWLLTARKELEAAGLKTALQMRKNRNGDNPVYAWLTGLLAAVCDPENTFEWVGVLREIFQVSDAQIAAELGAERRFHWDEPERHAPPLQAALRALRPFVERIEAEGEPLERFACDLVQMAGLAGKAKLVDPSGSLNAELERLLTRAFDLGLEGAGPRAWLQELRAGLEHGRPSGKSSDDAINLLTAHSAKGLEWPVVIPIGLWRPIGKREATGLRLVPDETGTPRVFFDGASLPTVTKDSRERERRRELVRLLYVTLTRARRALILPHGEKIEDGSFLELWGADLAGLPVATGQAVVEAPPSPTPPTPPAPPALAGARPVVTAGAPAFPQRVLPHQLAKHPDQIRAVKNDPAWEDVLPAGRDDPIEYGLWWHETMEFMPWTKSAAERQGHLESALAAARARGFAARAVRELELLQGSVVWRDFISGQWRIFAELGVMAPLGGLTWVDGIIDLVAERSGSTELLVIDWKTNARRKDETVPELLRRLTDEYTPQLTAYGSCLGRLFPQHQVSLGIYATSSGTLATVPR